MFKKIFSDQSTIKRATALLIITLIVSNVLGMLRDHFLASRVSTYSLDVYYAAFKIPDLIFNVLVLGAISSVFIPIFTEKVAHQKEGRAREITNRLMTASLVFTGLFAVILYFTLPWLIPLLVPRFSADRLAQTVKIARIISLTPILFSLSYITSGVLNSYRRFLAYSMAPLVYNLAIIFGTLLLVNRFDIVGVAWAVVAGAFLHFLVQIPSILQTGFKYRLEKFWHDKDLFRIVRLMIPRSIGLGTSQITTLAFTAIASALAAGSIAVFTFADNIQTMPVVVFGTSLATVLFPTLSAEIAENNKENFAGYFTRALKAIIYIMLPTSVVFYLLSNQIVRLILGSGKFSLFDTSRAGQTLAAFCFGLVFEAVLALIVKAFFAQKNTRLPMYAGLLAMFSAIAFGYLLSRFFGVPGLALGLAAGNLISVVYLMYYLNKRFVKVDFGDLSKFVAKSLVSAAATGLITFLLIKITFYFVDLRHYFGILTQTLVSALGGIIGFCIVSKWLGVEEYDSIVKNIFVRFKPPQEAPFEEK